jgi:hypothetical protein
MVAGSAIKIIGKPRTAPHPVDVNRMPGTRITAPVKLMMSPHVNL